MPGPAPKDPEQRARRNPTVAMTKLPASGRKGRVPAWPLPPDLVMQIHREAAQRSIQSLRDEAAGLPPSKARIKLGQAEKAAREVSMLDAQIKAQKKLEGELWRDLWKTPQATQWEMSGWTRDVAQYVRHKVRAELGSLDDAKEARQLADRLGLTPLALLRLRWRIGDKEDGKSKSPRKSGSASRSRRGPLYAVPDAKASGE